MTLTKADIVAQVYAQGQLTKAEAADAVERGLELIKEALSYGEEVLVSGFGKWSVREKAERRGRNPQTGDPLILPPRKVVTFRPSRVLKAKVQAQLKGQGSAPDSADGRQPAGKVIRPGYF
ncbi:MAG: integration host factor subunit alpha [Desulfarculaceae bacterium]|nr:integration host factor subunit alpha [Desulfarculaceae bacterium]MCF8074121.1 integration host factor subunit alpha [Desulfarculaceae bacterium]MCF8103287.1 integration host factor subunit alpha [Desulfarculaceae bacterium]MCF8116855.1 integration host factor subunit alpha [Desulfarculaceae bacterium]